MGELPREGDVSRALLASALMASAGVQVVLDREARLVLANRRAADRFDITGRDLGCPVEELGLARLPVDLRAHLDEAREHEGALWLHDLVLPEGPTYDVEVVALHDGWTVVLHDTTRVRHLQAELGRANQGLASAEQQQDATPPTAGGEGTDVALGEVSIVDLFVILVEHHRFEVREAVRQLTIGLVRAGYPSDHESVAASDAMDILEVILGTGRS